MSITRGLRSRSPLWLALGAAAILSLAAVGCSSGSNSSQSGSSDGGSASTTTEKATEGTLAEACGNVDGDAILASAEDFADAAVKVDTAEGLDETIGALIDTLTTGAAFFNTFGGELEPVFTQVSEITGDRSFADVIVKISDGATLLEEAAANVEANGLTEQTSAEVERSLAGLEDLGSLNNLNASSSGAAEDLGDISECRALEEIFSGVDQILERIG